MWIVRVALDRPYTFIVLALLILIIRPLAVLRTPTDIFPNIDIPVIAVAWSYTGLNPEEMEGRITSVYERVLRHWSTISSISSRQPIPDGPSSRSFCSRAPSLDTANAQVTAASQTILRRTAAGHPAALIMNYSASSVPILQLGLSSKTISESSSTISGSTLCVPQLVTVPGAVVPYPYGGKQRQVSVDLESGTAAVQGALARRCSERAWQAEPGAAVRNRENRSNSNTTFVSTQSRHDRAS